MALVNEFARLEGLNGEFLAWGNWRPTTENTILIDVHFHNTDTDAFGTFETTLESLNDWKLRLHYLTWFDRKTIYFTSLCGRFDMRLGVASKRDEVVPISGFLTSSLDTDIGYEYEVIPTQGTISTFVTRLADTIGFNFELFKQRLTETSAWCLRRFSVKNIQSCLRRPPIPENYPGHLETRQIIDHAPSVFKKRKGEWRDPYQDILAGGRLFIFDMWSLMDGTSPPETEDFIDGGDVIAWDTWVWLDTWGLIAWVPKQMLDDVNNAIRMNPYGIIRWLKFQDSPYGQLFREAGLIEVTLDAPFAKLDADIELGEFQRKSDNAVQFDAYIDIAGQVGITTVEDTLTNFERLTQLIKSLPKLPFEYHSLDGKFELSVRQAQEKYWYNHIHTYLAVRGSILTKKERLLFELKLDSFERFGTEIAKVLGRAVDGIGK